MKPRSLKDSVQYIKGVGPKRALLLNKLGIETVEDGLYFLPHRYEDRSRVKNISAMVPGEHVTFSAQILDVGTFYMGRRRKIFEIVLQDDTGVIRAKWYRCNEKYLRKKFQTGLQVLVSGKPAVNRYSGSGLEIIHPDIDIITGDQPGSLEAGRVVPVYHTTEGLHIKSIRQIMKHVVDDYTPLVEEFLPEPVLKRHQFPPRAKAIEQAHFPPNGFTEKELDGFKTPAHQRLIFEELFLLQLGLALRKKHRALSAKGIPMKTRGQTIQRFVRLLQFELTGAQKRVLGEIMDDLEGEHPMNRLLHGDVGSGKTIIALISLLTAVDNGLQGALMAPTEILVEQHYLNILPFCQRLGLTLELVTSAATPKEKKRIQQNIREGKTHIVVGTHALIQKDIHFHRLGLAVIDEQHRFGVLQREALSKKGLEPHILVMTATPIPRSLAMVLYGDMEVSVLDEMPPGRQPIDTRLFYADQRQEAYEFLRQELAAGRQAYVVAPMIEGTGSSELKTVNEVQEYLQKEVFPDRVVRIIHGKLKKEDKQEIMAAFNNGDIHILVATTVIEVGIDVANATVMVVEHAERFGLSQLHQLRGRVGRGTHASHCLLIAYHPVTDEGKARLDAMLKSGDGFVIAEEDLILRGPGDFMGTRQSGLPDLKIADLVRDLKTIGLARKEAFTLIDSDPTLEEPHHQKLKQALIYFLGDRLSLMQVI